jgi:hypothetical protein
MDKRCDALIEIAEALDSVGERAARPSVFVQQLLLLRPAHLWAHNLGAHDRIVPAPLILASAAATAREKTINANISAKRVSH